MIQAIFGRKGSGKTKRIIDIANDSLQTETGNVVFIDDDKRYMYDLRHEIRFVDASEYDITCADMFLGFISGILAQNFDVTLIIVDAFMKLVKTDIAQLEGLFKKLNELSDKRHVKFLLSISAESDETPEFLKQYII